MADVFSDDNVERILSDHEGLHTRVEELDMLITESEVKKAISSLKKRKSPGADLLPPEVFIEGCEILSPVLCRLSTIYSTMVFILKAGPRVFWCQYQKREIRRM